MSYTTIDFAESLNRVQINPSAIETVIAAWGGGDGQGTDSGPGWSAEGVTEWYGGFLLRLKDGRHAYVYGWCDYTGWGCQDGAEVKFYDECPALIDIKASSEYSTQPHDWDESPDDLNRWLVAGGIHPYDA